MPGSHRGGIVVIVYLASPQNEMQCDYLRDMPTLLSFGAKRDMWDSWQQSFRRILIDSGAYTERTTGKKVDGVAYRDWWQRWVGHADAIAGLDDIAGNWQRSLKNYAAFGGFPTMHDSDPKELLSELVSISKEQGDNWIGIGLQPGKRQGKESFVRWVCDNVPEDMHVHGWALRAYTHVRRLDSVDSTNWFRDAWQIKNAHPWLTPGECLEIIVKRYQRWTRKIREPKTTARELL
jgi:hypothetical protein